MKKMRIVSNKPKKPKTEAQRARRMRAQLRRGAGGHGYHGPMGVHPNQIRRIEKAFMHHDDDKEILSPETHKMHEPDMLDAIKEDERAQGIGLDPEEKVIDQSELKYKLKLEHEEKVARMRRKKNKIRYGEGSFGDICDSRTYKDLQRKETSSESEETKSEDEVWGKWPTMPKEELAKRLPPGVDLPDWLWDRTENGTKNNDDDMFYEDEEGEMKMKNPMLPTEKRWPTKEEEMKEADSIPWGNNTYFDFFGEGGGKWPNWSEAPEGAWQPPEPLEKRFRNEEVFKARQENFILIYGKSYQCYT